MKKLLLVSLCFLCLFVTQIYAQNRTITGTVTSLDDGLSLTGVTVTASGGTARTATNASGRFSLSVPAGTVSVTFTFIGFESQTVKLTAKNEVDVILKSTTTSLSEVVVTAGGLTTTKAAQGYQATQIKAEQLTEGKAFNVGSALSGKVAGLQVSTIASGLNPTVRLELRGARSFLGNNQALLVLDNIIVPSSLLGNINPEDIDDIEVLNGGQGAALYGVDASNGVIIITTKKGKKGKAQVKASQTLAGEKISFFPKTQSAFGTGTQSDVNEYLPTENQQFGAAYDGTSRIIGYVLANGAAQFAPYSNTNDRNDFWQTGVTNQSDFSVSQGDERSSTYVAGQYLTKTGTTPGDKYNRFSMRVNGSSNLANNVSIGYNVNYVQNRYDQTTGAPYGDVEQTAGNVPLTSYKDIVNNPFASNDGFYNFYYSNPYRDIAVFRQLVRNDILTGSIEAKWDPFKFLNFTFRSGITTTNATSKSTTDKYTPSLYTQSLGSYGEGAGATIVSPQVGAVSDNDNFNTRVTADFLATFKKQFHDFNVNFVVGVTTRQDKSQTETINSNGGILQAGLFNVGARIQTNPNGSESQQITRQQGAYGVLNLGYKGWINLHVTGRNDWLSTLPVQNYSFFYPAADVSFIATEAINALKNNKVLTSLKIRGGVAKVGNANIGAYALVPTFSPGSGYPYPSGPGYNQDDGIVSPGLKPEMTKSYEFGADADLFNGRLSAGITYFHSSTTDQTVTVTISGTTGFTGYLLNTGQMDAQGVESRLSFIPLKTSTGWQLTVGGNYTWLNNNVVSIPAGLAQLPIGSVWARPGYPYPLLEGTDYIRDPQGRVVVNAKTGLPAPTASSTNILGGSSPTQRIGINFEVRYKTLRLSATAEYRGGFIVNSAGFATAYDFSGSGYRSAYYNRERFVFPNSSYLDPAGSGNYIANNNITVADGGSSFWSSGTYDTNETTNYVYNGASWRLREATLSWDVPKDIIGHQKYVKSATISVQGRNLLLWVPKSNIYTDPEFTNDAANGNQAGVNGTGQTPPTRYFGGTLSLTF